MHAILLLHILNYILSWYQHVDIAVLPSKNYYQRGVLVPIQFETKDNSWENMLYKISHGGMKSD